jgi:hypothetical protein
MSEKENKEGDTEGTVAEKNKEYVEECTKKLLMEHKSASSSKSTLQAYC